MAMLTIIAYHYNYPWAKGGFLGVDTFFVLSGFLITTLLVLEFRRESTLRFAAFWARRALVGCCPRCCSCCALSRSTRICRCCHGSASRVRDDGFASLFYVANWRFIFDNQDYFQLFSAASPLRHMWSLAIEEQYYLVWPLVVLACLRLARGSLRILQRLCASSEPSPRSSP